MGYVGTRNRQINQPIERTDGTKVHKRQNLHYEIGQTNVSKERKFFLTETRIDKL